MRQRENKAQKAPNVKQNREERYKRENNQDGGGEHNEQDFRKITNLGKKREENVAEKTRQREETKSGHWGTFLCVSGERRIPVSGCVGSAVPLSMPPIGGSIHLGRGMSAQPGRGESLMDRVDRPWPLEDGGRKAGESHGSRRY